ncbi:MAG: cell division protein SepF [Firmicutes bacterium]|nr:cell division protein SepF [Bacillota bacterium]MCL1954155.1 cell division protein SepF [Bacillota bacterium]
MGTFEDFLNKGSNYQRGSLPEYYEDTHDKNGNYRALPNAFNSSTQIHNGQERSAWALQNPISNSTVVSNTTSQSQNPYVQSTSQTYIPPYSSQQYISPPVSNVQLGIGQPNLQTMGMPLPSSHNPIASRNYSNLVIYQPTTPEDVEMLIDYLKRKEPAIINLDHIDDMRAQRVLDFVSGAIFALNGSIQRVSSNIFLVCPEGIQVTTPL